VQTLSSAAAPRWASGIAAGLAAAGIGHIVYVPDNPLSHILGAAQRQSPAIPQTLATREEEAVGIAAGLYLGGVKPAILMQSSGLGNCANAVASLLVAYQVPLVFVMSMRGDPGEWNWAQVPLGRAIRPILDALGIQHLEVSSDDEAERTVGTACATAFSTRFPIACLLPRRLTTPLPGADARGEVGNDAE
jgi:sulfopyruvate decarboxylase alpha subunit